MSVIIKNPIIVAGKGGGAELKPLTNPATAADIKQGYQAYGDDGKVIVGAYTVSDVHPQLNPVTIAKSGNNLNITNPSTNGNFVAGYKVYGDGELKHEQEGTTFDLLSLIPNKYAITVRAKKDGFIDSADSNTVNVAVFDIVYNLTNINASISTAKTTNGQTLSFTLTPVTGKYLPPDIQIECNGRALDHTYNGYTGAVSINAIALEYADVAPDGSKLNAPTLTLDQENEKISISYVPRATTFEIYAGNTKLGEFGAEGAKNTISITAVALDVPKLHTPVLSIDGDTLYAEPPKFATSLEYYMNGVLFSTDTDLPVSTFDVVAVSGASYGFELNSAGYYVSKNYHVTNSAALCKVTFNVSAETQVRLDCISYGESNYDYGIISQLDKTLATSNTDDGNTGTTNVLKNFKGASSANVQTVTLTVPAGEHYIYVKYRKDSSGDNGNDTLQFKVNLL